MRTVAATLGATGFVAALFVSRGPALAVLTSSKLVYAFTFSSEQNTASRDSSQGQVPTDANGNPTVRGSGAIETRGNLTDKGTMTVQIVRRQSDGGLVVTISEQGESVRRAPAATCVVYGDTHVICDPNKTVYSEEYTLLRFLGANFVDPSQLDANRHWQLSQSAPDETVTSDFTINSNSSGIMQIGEKRTIKDTGAGHVTSDVQTKISYDFSRAVPTAVDEYVTQHVDNGLRGTSTTTYQTTLSLVSSSSAAAAGP